jgi:hypothetical protein
LIGCREEEEEEGEACADELGGKKKKRKVERDGPASPPSCRFGRASSW